MFKNQGRFSYLFSFLVSNATDGQEAEPDHPQRCFNANVKFHNVKKHRSHDPDSRGPSVDASLHCILPLHLLAEGRRSRIETTTSPWQQAGWGLCQSNRLLACLCQVGLRVPRQLPQQQLGRRTGSFPRF